MKQHAIAYTYDRMKGIFPLSFVICECANQLMSEKSRKTSAVPILLVACLMCGLNLKSYLGDETYIWSTNYRAGNQEIATYINENYSDSILDTENVAVRGYMNLLFMRGIREWRSSDRAKEIAASQGKRYAVILRAKYEPGNVYDLTGATIYDLQTGEAFQLTEEDGNLTSSIIQP